MTNKIDEQLGKLEEIIIDNENISQDIKDEVRGIINEINSESDLLRFKYEEAIDELSMVLDCKNEINEAELKIKDVL